MPDADLTTRLEASLDAYRRHQLAAGALFWLPTTFLFLVEQHGLARALWLQAVYYIAVVVFEVPSGWFSDRVSRVLTLRTTAIAWMIAHAVFALAPSLAGVIVAQMLLAVGYAFTSGTDVTLHYDTLESLGRRNEFDRMEAASRRGLLLVTATTAVVGGALGFFDLRLPFAASLIAAAVQLAFATKLVEPPRTPNSLSFAVDIARSARLLKRPTMRWLTLYIVAQVTLVHLVAELAGPHLTAVLDEPLTEPARAALAIGVLSAAAALGGAISLSYLPGVARRFGMVPTMVAASVVPAVTVVAMSFTTSWWILLLFAARGIPGATTAVLGPTIVGAHVSRDQRATVLSLTSLLGRLVYGTTLVTFAHLTGGVLMDSLDAAAWVALAMWAAVAAAALLWRVGPLRISGDG